MVLVDRSMLMMLEMGVAGQTKLEAKLEICYTIVNVEGESGLAGSPGPDIHNLLEAPEEEGLLSH